MCFQQRPAAGGQQAEQPAGLSAARSTGLAHGPAADGGLNLVSTAGTGADKTTAAADWAEATESGSVRTPTMSPVIGLSRVSPSDCPGLTVALTVALTVGPLPGQGVLASRANGGGQRSSRPAGATRSAGRLHRRRPAAVPAAGKGAGAGAFACAALRQSLRTRSSTVL